MEKQKGKGYVCELCGKSCVSSKVLGGHMRSHAFKNPVKSERKHKESNNFEDEADGNVGYGLRLNPKKSWKFSGKDEKEEEIVCKVCGIRFDSKRAVFGHMRHHSVKQRDEAQWCRDCGKGFESLKALSVHRRFHTKRLRGWDEPEDISTQKLCIESLGLVRRKRSARLRYRIATPSSPFSSLNESKYGYGYGVDIEDATFCLMMISRGLGDWGQISSVAESSNNNSFSFEVVSPSQKNRVRDDEGEVLVCDDDSGSSQFKRAKVDILAGYVSDCENGCNVKEVSEYGEIDSGFVSDEMPKSGFMFYGIEIEKEACGEMELDVEITEEVEMGPSVLGSMKFGLNKKAMLKTCDSVNKVVCANESEIFAASEKKREHKCRICKRIFGTHQALGGHQRVRKRSYKSSMLKIKDDEDKTQIDPCNADKLEGIDNSVDQEMERVTMAAKLFIFKVGDADIIRMLLKTNADANATDGEGNCALHWILKWSRLCPLQIMILLLLLEHGAQVSQRNTLGLTAFHIAASHGNLEALKLLLLEDPNGVNYVTDTKETPLFFAVWHESMDCAKLLLTSGANSEILNLRGQRAIDLAISQNMRYILLKQTSVSLINLAFPSQNKCPALGLTDDDTSTKSKAEVANKGKGTINSAIRTNNSEVVIGVDSRISYAGQRRDTQTKFEILSATILATMAGNVAECQKAWTCMKERVSNNILEGNEPASIYSIAKVGYDIERTIDDRDCECFIVGVQNDKAEMYYLLDEYSETLKRRVRKLDDIEECRVIGSGAIYASPELKRKLKDRNDGPSFEEAIELTKYALLLAALQDSFVGGPLWVLHIMSDSIKKWSNNAVELYIEFYPRFRELEERSIFLFYIPEIDKKTLRKTLRKKGTVVIEGHPFTQLEGRYYIHRVIYKKEEAATLLYNGAERVSNSQRPPFTDWPTLKVFQIKGKKIFLARQSRDFLLSLKFPSEETSLG